MTSVRDNGSNSNKQAKFFSCQISQFLLAAIGAVFVVVVVVDVAAVVLVLVANIRPKCPCVTELGSRSHRHSHRSAVYAYFGSELGVLAKVCLPWNLRKVCIVIRNGHG